MIELTLPYPPSANRYWRNYKGRMVKSAQATAYIKAVRTTHADIEPMEGDLSIRLNFYRPARRGDVDNMLKVAIDSLREIAYQDDKQIAHIEATRYEDKRRPRVEITIQPYPIGAEDICEVPYSQVS